MVILRSVLGFLVIGACFVSTAFGQSCYQASDGSKLTVSGSATVRSFSCESTTIEGRAVMDTQSTDSVKIDLQVPVRSFDCGKRAMNEDLYEALKADEHPYIHYRVRRTNIVSGEETGDQQIRIVGALSMAGTTRGDTTIVKGRPAPDQSFRVEGSTPLSLRQFGVDPPTALLGLIQVKDSVTVSVDLLGSPTCTGSNETTIGQNLN
jgi:polyisoprenoid-binding protein YceI